MIKIGMILGDRYEILEKIGTGGMSDVYKARDEKLNRQVAVKVLKQEFSENDNFVSKFQSEAQAAAGLMHPNIVNVYDVGVDDGVHYIVMELVEGITLKKYIEKKIRLTVKEAVSIAIQVSQGIEAAHNNHIIHRDIKPQNIIISMDGKVKVTDFGIAKAATSNTITSSVMGSVHYSSPEQARGGYSDEKSDVYSLGITLFEMLTGRVPFNGDTTVAIAIKHIQERMPSPCEYVEDIPISVEQIVVKCTQKSPDKRYPSISKLLEDLKQSLKTPDVNFVVLDSQEKIGKTRVADEETAEKARKKTRGDSHTSSLRLNDNDRAKPRKKDNSKKKSDSRTESITTMIAIAAAVVFGCVILFFVGKALGIMGSPAADDREVAKANTAEMPELEGVSLTRAKLMLNDLGLEYEVIYEDSSKYEEDIVIQSNIKAGRTVEVGTVIELTVSAGQQGVLVPDVSGKSLAEATAILEKEGFKVTRADVSSDTCAKGTVVQQSPAGGSKAPRGSAINLSVSSGPDDSKILVPGVMGLSEMDATVILTEAGLTVGTVEEVNFDDPALTGLVCYQNAEYGAYVDPGTPINLKISIGPSDYTYSFSAQIDSPAAEDPGFVAGTQVTVILATADNNELVRTSTDTFPVAMNMSGIKGSSTGKIIFQYVSAQGTPVAFERAVSFVRES